MYCFNIKAILYDILYFWTQRNYTTGDNDLAPVSTVTHMRQDANGR